MAHSGPRHGVNSVKASTGRWLSRWLIVAFALGVLALLWGILLTFVTALPINRGRVIEGVAPFIVSSLCLSATGVISLWAIRTKHGDVLARTRLLILILSAFGVLVCVLYLVSMWVYLKPEQRSRLFGL